MSWILFCSLTLIIFPDDLHFILEFTPLLKELKQLSGTGLLEEVRQYNFLGTVSAVLNGSEQRRGEEHQNH